MLFTGLLIGIFFLVVLGWWKAWLPAVNGLRVLMYHKVVDGMEDGLSVRPETLKRQMDLMLDCGFEAITLDQLHLHLDQNQPLPKQCFLLTFDDAYCNNLNLAAPVMSDFKVRPVVFVPTAFVGKTNVWDQGIDPLMNWDELKSLQNLGWDLGLHGHQHKHLGTIDETDVRSDLQEMTQLDGDYASLFHSSLAYPYGGRPKTKPAQNRLFQILKSLNIRSAFRIGNRINSLPIHNRYLIQRIDIKGNMTDLAFVRKVKYGKLF